MLPLAANRTPRSILSARAPVRVTGSGGIYYHKDREVPDQYNTIIEYPNFYVCLHSGDNTAGPRAYSPTAIYGRKGTILLQPNRVEVAPGRSRPGQEAPKSKVYEVSEGDFWRAHSDDFFPAMRTRKKPILHEEFGFMIMVALKLGNESYLEGKVKFFDAQTRTVAEKGPPRPSYEGTGA